MGKYQVVYEGMDNAITTTENYQKKLENIENQIRDCCKTLQDENYFMGPIYEAYVGGNSAKIPKIHIKVARIIENLGIASDFLNTAKENYMQADNDASKEVKLDSKLKTNGYKLEIVDNTGVNTGNTNRDEVYNLLSEAGYNNAAICGILGNIEHESNFNPEAVGDYGASHGLCQWYDKYGRWTEVKNYCKENGLDPNSVEGQVKFMIDDMKNYKLDIYMKNVPNTPEGAAAAADKWTRVYERPADIDNQAASRGNKAQYTYFDLYGNQ